MTNDTATQFLAWLKRKMKEDWGERCKEYEYGCPVCEVWKYYDKLKQ